MFGVSQLVDGGVKYKGGGWNRDFKACGDDCRRKERRAVESGFDAA